MKRAAYFFQLIRWPNLLLLMLTQLLAYFFLQKNYYFYPYIHWELLYVCASTLLIAAGGYLINDYFDLKIDVINKPEKMVLGKYINRRHALILHLLFTAVGVLMGLAVDKYLGILNLIVALSLWKYSARWKCRPLWGNLSVALLMALSVFVVVFSSSFIDYNWVIFYSFFALITGLIREVIKDIEDKEGDEAAGCKTFPVTFGILRAKFVLYYLLAFAMIMLAAGSGWLFYQGRLIPAVYLLLAVMLPAAYIFYGIAKAESKRDFHRLSTGMKLLMLAGIISMMLKGI